jgi:hypothetical protein
MLASAPHSDDGTPWQKNQEEELNVPKMWQ